MGRKKTANISGSLYDGDFSLNYDCVGEVSCEFALCSVMPPDDDSNCFFMECGSCRHPAAQKAAIKALRSRMARALKQLDEAEL